MFYEEKLIDGRLYCRGTPDGEWRLVTIDALTRRVLAAEADLERAMENHAADLSAAPEELTIWHPISDPVPPGERNTVLTYHPGRENDPDFPGHAVGISNRDYINIGNAAQAGYTLWAEIPSGLPALGSEPAWMVSSVLIQERLTRLVAGALRACVNDHGSTVEGSWIGSATKRIVHQILARDDGSDMNNGEVSR
jgi:hypothetical protein